MKRIALLFTLFAFAAVLATAQSPNAFSITQGTDPVSQRTCNGISNLGSIYTRLSGTPSVSYLCQRGSSGAFSWSALSSLNAPLPASAGATAVGSAALPFSSVYVGNAATNNLKLTGTATGARTIMFPDASITVPGTIGQTCGTTTTCAHTNISTTMKVVTGSVALSSGSPSTAAITGISPAFTSSSSYHCTVNNQTTRTNQVAVLAAGYVSGSAFTITGPNTVTDVVDYVCFGQ